MGSQDVIALWQALTLLFLPLGLVALAVALAEVRRLDWIMNLGLTFAAIAVGLLFSIVVMYSDSLTLYGVALVTVFALWGAAFYVRFVRSHS